MSGQLVNKLAPGASSGQHILDSMVYLIADLVFSLEPVRTHSVLEYSIETLDDGAEKDQRHSAELEKSDYVTVCIDKVQMGLGCVNSWGMIPRDEYRIPYRDYDFSFCHFPGETHVCERDLNEIPLSHEI